MTRLEPFTEAVLPYMPFLIPLPVILPALAAAGCLLFPRMLNVRRAFVFFTLLALAVLSATMLIVVDGEGIQTLQIGGWDAPLGITLVADRLSTMMLFVSSIILFAVMWFAIAQGIRDDTKDEPVAVFLPSYMLLTMGVNLSFLAGDLFNLYVGFEIFLVASYVLMTLGASPSRVRAGVGYVMVSMASSMVFLFGIAVTYAAVGTVNLAQIGQRMEDIPGGTQAAIFGVLLVAFGIKAAVFPLDSWLPDAYPTAPSLVTAVFAGLLTKVGVYAIIRMRTTVFTDGSLDALLMLVALATMLIGILGAMAQNDIKRLLSFTLVSHIGFMIFGIGLGSSQGLSGAIFYMVHHILVQTALFLVVGLIERHAGTSSLRRLGSLMYTAPIIAVLYLIPALNLGGIPPFSGFMGKVMLFHAGAEANTWMSWVLIGGAVVTSLLTLYVMVMVWSKGFLRDRKDAPEGNMAIARPAPLADITQEVEFSERESVGRTPFGMIAATAMLVLASSAISVVAGPIASITDRAANSTQDVNIYRTAVLGTDPSEPTRNLELERLDDGEDRREESEENTESSTSVKGGDS
ncbi:Na+/H+ antiporter subunit D [Corynebacterium propinquum]|uniref:Na+/H+ antiporter subunit D n=1 Tax=Corynebacterium propinquum TaxID=43769 RepID=A0ABT7G2J9_9CORY|nr:Na+/H+ antiporter subunit D [Corynebacterium propinquum]MDK4234910.1 Na+/H+ antiporter subunit D [Corynebacterium propinquum]MDK4238415.1 Na+/H+ antiporter subunit D [Corynebacterium propinquum]MDK4300746.1 Na+/H+ antiporter subunit D [Corynebacterium propinquum]MDK4314019.1 Na+/H+ antiporter subunit D [Corynebacterium propinquum]WKS48654.1 Na+/H+ antiporter subunit D [Corynebacterium propinquum]